MDIVKRNFFRLLKAGAFHRTEVVEPMSAWKWRKVYELALLHGVETLAFQGVKRLEGQFFFNLPDALRQQWAAGQNVAQEDYEIGNRQLAKRLKRLEEETGGSDSYKVLKASVAVALCLMSADRWVYHLVRLGQIVEQAGDRVDRGQLKQWAAQLRLQHMEQLEGALLVELLGQEAGRWPFDLNIDERQRKQMAEEVGATLAATRHQWSFSTAQSSNDGQVQHTIFVHNSNSSAMFWQARHSARYLKYYPTMSISTFFNSLAQSLTNIEE